MRQGLDDDEHPLPFSLLFFSSASNDFVIQMRARADTDRGVALRSEVPIGGGKPQLHRLCSIRTRLLCTYVRVEAQIVVRLNSGTFVVERILIVAGRKISNWQLFTERIYQITR